MFEKYKDIKEKRSHFGMTKKEYYKIAFMVLITLGCLVAIIFSWKSPPKKEGPEVEIPTNGAEIIINPGPERAGSPGAKTKFEEIRNKLMEERRLAEGETESVILPEIPKPPTPWEPNQDIWKEVNDAATDQLEEQVVLYALHQLNSMTQEEIAKKIEEDGNLPLADFVDNPNAFRGKFISVTGTLLMLDNMVLSPNRSGLNQYWYGLIYNQRLKRHRRIYFYIFDKDRSWLTQQEARARDLTCNGDLVTVKGVFVKMYRNTTESGAVMTYPFIIARKLEKSQTITVKERYPWTMLSFVGILFAAVFILFFMAMRRDRKADEDFTQSRKHKKAGKINNELLKKAVKQIKGKNSASENNAENLAAPLDNNPAATGESTENTDSGTEPSGSDENNPEKQE